MAASLHPFAGLTNSWLAEYPMEPKALCAELNLNKIEIQSDGMICLPYKPGLGVDFNLSTIKKYLVDVEIKVSGKTLYKSPVI